MLYETFMEPCTTMVRVRVPDGEGGWATQWADGYGFEAAIVKRSASTGTVAEKADEHGEYTVTTARDMVLPFHKAFRRLSDDRTFRVVKEYDPTPGASSFQFNQYGANEWEQS